MKRLFTFISMAVLLITGAAQLNAQNRCVLKNDKGAKQVITYSDDLLMIRNDDQMASLVTKPKVKPQIKSDKQTFTLNVYPPENADWMNIFLCDSVDVIDYLFNGMGDSLTVELERGVYHLASSGFLSEEGQDFYNCTWILEDIEINNDTAICIDYHDCVYALNLYAEGEYGNPLSDMYYLSVFYDVSLTWRQNVTFMNMIFAGAFDERVPIVRYNGFDENSNLLLGVYAEPGFQKSYVITCFVNGMNESPYFTVKADELGLVQEWFTVREDSDSSYYHTDTHTILNEDGAWTMSQGFISELLFDPNNPYTIVSNSRIDDPISFENGQKTILLPTIYEWYDLYGFSWPSYDDRIGTSLYFNAQGDAVREAMPFFRDGPTCASWPNYFPETPAMKVTPADKMIRFGERTPLATYYPTAFNADNTPFDQTFFYGGFFFSGENSCERQCDYDAIIRVNIDDQEVYCDSVYKFNWDGSYYQFGPAEFPAIMVQVKNGHLKANGVAKSNYTRVEFDLNRDDAMPPTMTFLRVLDGNGDESVCLDDLSQSTIVFGCGDYTYHYQEHEWGGYYDHLEYNAKPEVEVLYCAEGGDWQPLVIAEDESLFHINYGNVFVADLSQLESRALNKWVSLKFMLEDAAGNTQEQTLENVFYSGHTISVSEYTAERLEHEVSPNPFTEEVRIKSAQPLDGAARVQLYDVLGRRVYDATENGQAVNEFIIDGSALKPGIYFYDINTKKGVMRGKIVKN